MIIGELIFLHLKCSPTVRRELVDFTSSEHSLEKCPLGGSWLDSKFGIFGGSYKSFVITLENQFFVVMNIQEGKYISILLLCSRHLTFQLLYRQRHNS